MTALRYPPVCDFLHGEWLREECGRGVLPEPEADPSPARGRPDLAPLDRAVERLPSEERAALAHARAQSGASGVCSGWV
ncbi:hypothetical protein [Streptomyces sp. NPDC005760]|uniref:hypothetical protein n=1 Tax=Streptomyces sp. NPDC005760 TaxID=3156718 RepID=UPI0033F6E479